MDTKTVEAARHSRASRTIRWCAASAVLRPTRRMTGQAYAYFVRSPHAFARHPLDRHRGRASAVPGVLAVLTAADMEGGVGNVSQHPPLTGRGGKKLIMPHRPALAGDRACMSASRSPWWSRETLTAAQDAAELVAVDYEERTPVVDLRAARARRRAAAVAGGAGQYRGRLAGHWPAIPTPTRSEVERDHRVRQARRARAVVQSANHGRLHGAARRDGEL